MFLSLALGISHSLSFQVRTVRPEQFSADVLSKTALVILNGAAIPGREAGNRLVDYVNAGGGLLVVLGSQSRPNEWPSLADKLLPRPVARVIDRTTDQGATLEYMDHGHSVFEVFNSPHSGNFSNARFLRYWSVKPQPGDRQLARFDDGNVALLERHVGAGRVLVWSSDMDGVWNDFPLQPVFLPLVQQMAKYGAGYKNELQWQTVGQVVSMPAMFGENTRRSDSTAARGAAGEAQYVAISPSGVQTRFSTNASVQPASLELTEQGFYNIARSGGAGDSTRTMAVNADLTESDMAQLDTGLLARAVAPRANTDAKMTAGGEMLPSNIERQQNIWWYLFAAALLLLGAETLFSNRLSRAVR
jgi:hypothetical protein